MGRALAGVIDPEEEAPLLGIDAYLEKVLSLVEPLAPRGVPLAEAWGCVLVSDEVAPSDLPGFTSSAMDGFAVRSADIAGASETSPVELRVTGEVRMGRGSAPAPEVGPGEAVSVPTGGVVPRGSDAVVPVELCEVRDERVLVLRALPSGKHVRPAGEDARAGDVLVGAGRVLRAPDLGALAAAGLDTVEVRPRARVGIVSTGDELVRPPKALREGQLYDSNHYVLDACVREAGAIPVDGGIASDEPGALTGALDLIAPEVDAFLCSGGVSAGERDPVKRAFSGGGDVEFANVAMQPGRPQACGTYRGKPFLGLPGNPVSVFVSFVVFAEPALSRLMGREPGRAEVTATLEGDLEAPRTRTRYARVRVRRVNDVSVAAPEGGHQSNLLATFARADGLAVVPAGTRISSGEKCRVILVREVW